MQAFTYADEVQYNMDNTAYNSHLNSDIEGSNTSVKKKLLFMLSAYPALGHSMIQAGLGHSLPAREWRPVMENLISEGIVIKEEFHMSTPLGQFRAISRFRLAGVQLPEPSAIYNILVPPIDDVIAMSLGGRNTE